MLAGSALAEELEVVEMTPEDRASWSPTAIFAPITSLFRGGPGFWYSPREIEIRTTPPGAALDFFYVRRSFQKGFEQGDAPVRLVLPSPNEAGPYDSVKIRASLDGYKQEEVSVKLRSRQREVLIELEPLANSLMAVTHLYFADRASIGFLTKEAVTFRMQRGSDDYTLVLLETGSQPEALESLGEVRDSLVASLRPQQVGQDLIVRIALTERARRAEVDLRQRQSYDPVRRLHHFALELVPKGESGAAVQRAREALARIRAGHVSGCALRYENALRERLEPAALARALAPSSAFTAPYLRAAMRRLGEVSPGGVVVLTDGTRYRTDAPLELSAASSQAAEVQGYLALLRRFVAELEPEPYRTATLRGLIAPELGPKRFAAVLAAAEAAERQCALAQAARSPGSGAP